MHPAKIKYNMLVFWPWEGYARFIWSSLQKGKTWKKVFSTTFHVALLRIKKAIKGECNSIDAMAGPSNYVVDFTNAVDDNENLQLVLYWHVGGATYQVNNPRLLRHEWLDDSAIQRKWVVKKRYDPGWRVMLWRSEAAMLWISQPLTRSLEDVRTCQWSSWQRPPMQQWRQTYW